LLGHEFVSENFQYDRLTSLPVYRCTPIASTLARCHVDSYQLRGMSSYELADCSEDVTQSNTQGDGVTVTTSLTPDLHRHTGQLSLAIPL